MRKITQILRHGVSEKIKTSLENNPVTSILGPRQCGKTWLARSLNTKPENYFDLDQITDRTSLEESNFRVLDNLEGLVIIDEIQQMPALFSKLRVLADRPENDTRFLITGSASPRIVQGVSESLAGRNNTIFLGGFTTGEVGRDSTQKLWLDGGFPKAFLHEIAEYSMEWRLNYISNFLRRDIPLLADVKISDEQLRKLLLLVAHGHGQFWNHSEAAKMLGISYKTVQRYIELFKGAFIIRELPPYLINIKKRLKKSSKLYLRDSGLLHALISINGYQKLLEHPIYGASWEGFVIEQIIQTFHIREDNCYCWSVQGGEEIDLVIEGSNGRIGIECKAGEAPKKTKSMVNSMQSLNLEQLFVIYPGERDYPLDEKTEVLAFKNLDKLAKHLTL